MFFTGVRVSELRNLLLKIGSEPNWPANNDPNEYLWNSFITIKSVSYAAWNKLKNVTIILDLVILPNMKYVF